MKKVLVIGQGYMGFPMSLLLANSGYEVVGYDIDEGKINKIRKGISPFEETGLASLFENVLKNYPDRYKASSKIEAADVFVISVPTPKKNNRADMSFVFKAIKSIATVLEDDNLVILESTSPPKSTQKMADQLKKTGKQIYCAYCPERAFPGNTLHELVNNDRIVGGLDTESTEKAWSLYKSFCKGEVHKTNSLTAEVCKLTENAYRDVNIAFANELAVLGGELGFDAREVIRLSNKHPRVSILNPGPGVGGHCIPIDPLFLVQDTDSGNLIRTARKINDRMPEYVVQKLKKEFGKSLGTIAVMGITYKEDVDDYRESPALEIIHLLQKDKMNFVVSDPLVNQVKGADFKILSTEEALSKAQTLIISTSHKVYRDIDFNKYPNIKNILDSRGLIKPETKGLIKANVISS